MAPRLRKFALTAHVTASVGWLGAVAAFLALSVAGLTNQDAQLVRGAYLAMGLMAWYVILPLCLASLVTGIIQSLGTTWGLFRHYWVLMKLVINVLSTIILLIHMRPISYLAGVAAETTLSSGDHLQVRIQMVVASGAAVLALLVATMLSVYKPRGLTLYGRRKQHEQRTGSPAVDAATQSRS
jgi:hypothetical protein